MTHELIERLRDHARNVGGDPSYERLYGDEACKIADTIASLQARVAELESALRDIANAEGLGPATDIMAVRSLASACQSHARTALGEPNGQ